MGLFKIENHIPVIDVEIKTIKEFAKIITKDKDRFKKLAYKELAYIFHTTDFSSPYAIYQKEEREKRVIKDVGLDSDWKPDIYVKEAIEKYKELSETPTIKSVKAIKESLITSSKVIEAIQQSVENNLKHEETDDFDIDDMISKVDKLLTLSEKLPKAIESLNNLEEKVKAEQLGNSKLKGGGKLNAFEE